MRVTLAVPTYGIGVDTEIYRNHLLLVASSNGLIKNIGITQNELIHNARNKLVKETLEDEFTKPDEDFIMWLDQDVIVAPGTLVKLISDNKDIVTGLYFQKAVPYYPLIYGKKEDHKRGVFRSILDYPEGLHQLENWGGIGFGCVLTRVNVFKIVPEPWFEWTKDSGEDFDFCIKAKEYGVELWYDSEVLCGHQGERKVFTFDDFKPFKGGKFKLKET